MDISSVLGIFNVFSSRPRQYVKHVVDRDKSTHSPRSYYFPLSSPDQLTRLSRTAEQNEFSKPHSWIEANQGLDFGKTEVDVVVQVVNSNALVSVGRLIVKDNREPSAGIAIVPPPSGGPFAGNHLVVDLDAGDCHLVNGDRIPSDARVEYFQATPETPVLFTITASARERSSRWAIEFDLIVNGRTKTYRVPESGFFRTVAWGSAAVVTRYRRVDMQWVATP
ncbi:hypothetical protein KXR83_17885 [Williamsia muralis]|uniref:hypothetical protein n=1 Tax=Williamsia marianensis TaxID=85044 RepID=UPI003F178E8E